MRIGPLRIVFAYWIAVYWNDHCVSLAPRRLGGPDRFRWLGGFRLLWKD